MLDKKYKTPEEDHWLSVSDLMAGLMMVFLFISIALMREAMKERDTIKNVAIAYQDNQVAIYNALKKEFEKDLPKWDAVIDDKDLSFTFQSPDTLFSMGKDSLRKKYKIILDDFFPRYLNTILKFQDSINEVRIEGHTSSVWNGNTSKDIAYFKNMELSQGRTRSVLKYVHNLEEVNKNKIWIKKHIAAVGYSSSKRLIHNGKENMETSRRVTFRVITNADIQIRRIFEAE